MAPEIHARYQRAGELLDDVLAARGEHAAAHAAAAEPPTARAREDIQTPAEGARIAAAAVLLALPQAAARPRRSLPVLRRNAVASLTLNWRTGEFNLVTTIRQLPSRQSPDALRISS